MEWLKSKASALIEKLDYLTGRKYVEAVSCEVALYLFASAGHFDGVDPSIMVASVVAPWGVAIGGQAWGDFAKARNGIK